MARPEPLRILLSMRNFWYVRVFESVVRSIAARGHQIHLLTGHDPDPTGAWTDYVRFVQPAYAEAPILRDRAHAVLRPLLKRTLRAAERAVPPAPELAAADKQRQAWKATVAKDSRRLIHSSSES